jgi:ketosteroid isomerase-like protein
VKNNGLWQLASSAATQVSTPANRNGVQVGTAAAVREAAIAWTQAVVREDHPALQRLLADDLVFVHSGGQAPQNKAEYIASPENSTYEALPLRDINIRIYGNTAVLTAFLDTKHKGRETSPVKTLQIFKLNNGQWQLAAFQATRISPPTQTVR